MAPKVKIDFAQKVSPKKSFCQKGFSPKRLFAKKAFRQKSFSPKRRFAKTAFRQKGFSPKSGVNHMAGVTGTLIDKAFRQRDFRQTAFRQKAFRQKTSFAKNRLSPNGYHSRETTLKIIPGYMQLFQGDKTLKVNPGYAIIPGRQNPKSQSKECNYSRKARP